MKLLLIKYIFRITIGKVVEKVNGPPQKAITHDNALDHSLLWTTLPYCKICYLSYDA